jgi:hypothetical protein
MACPAKLQGETMSYIKEAIQQRLRELYDRAEGGSPEYSERERLAKEYRKIDDSFPMHPVFGGVAISAFMGFSCGIASPTDPSSWFITRIAGGITCGGIFACAVCLAGAIVAFVGYLLFGSRGFDIVWIAAIFSFDACFAVTFVFGQLPSEPSTSVYLWTFGILSMVCLAHSIRASIAHQERLTAFLNSMPRPDP